MAAIQKEIRVLESGLHDPDKFTTRSSTATFYVGSREYSSGKRHPVTPDSRRRTMCVFCKGSHSTHMCEVVMDYQK